MPTKKDSNAKLFSHIENVLMTYAEKYNKSKIKSFLKESVALFALLSPKYFDGVYGNIEKKLRKGGMIPGPKTRHMKYPYTFTAKIVQFPFFFYIRKNPLWTYYPPAFLIGLYLISYIHATVNSPGAVAAWQESQRINAEKEAAAHDH